MTLKLKPCPFCGSNPHVCHMRPYWFRCEKCGADAPSASSARRAADKWNKRQLYAYETYYLIKITSKNGQSDSELVL